jgi:bacillithiol biosynthesis cysteine-adding enzyme BshC
MEMKDLALPSLNRFASDYVDNRLDASDYFHYNLSDDGRFYDRYQELMNRKFLRAELASYINNYMSRFPKSKAVSENIKALKNEQSVTVIGGQQAGLLTGPLYTIHKVISIIKLAEEQEKALGQKVIPVFWIAGEDHDLAEVNHVFVMKNNKPEKKTYPLYHPFKTMVTDLQLDSETVTKWFDEVLETYGETAFTNKLREEMNEVMSQSKTFVDFFAALIHKWFHEYGLLLLDAGDPALRSIESRYFADLIDQAEQITESVLTQQNVMQQKGYKRTIIMSESAANLFYYEPKHKERILLDVNSGTFSGKNGEVSFTKKELYQIAEQYPEKLSNNVVTRPIMQEMLFPVLAFISGPGEIAYWAELKKAFELFSLKMPPIIPRLNITLVERGIATDLTETGFEIKTALTKGTSLAAKEFIDSIKDDSIDRLMEQTKRQLTENHHLISGKALLLDKGLEPLLQKNLFFLEQQLDFLQRKIDESTRKKHEVVLHKYERIEHSIFPLQSFQERTWNIFYYLNKYGPDFLKTLIDLPYTFNNEHKLIYL